MLSAGCNDRHRWPNRRKSNPCGHGVLNGGFQGSGRLNATGSEVEPGSEQEPHNDRAIPLRKSVESLLDQSSGPFTLRDRTRHIAYDIARYRRRSSAWRQRVRSACGEVRMSLEDEALQNCICFTRIASASHMDDPETLHAEILRPLRTSGAERAALHS
jgi:hypothetical protein